MSELRKFYTNVSNRNSTWSEFDLLFKDFYKGADTFTTMLDKRPTYPVDIYEQDDKLFIEIAVVGVDKSDIDIKLEYGNILKISYEKPTESKEDTKKRNYISNSITRKSFSLGWKIDIKYDLNELNATMNNGLLKIEIPLSKELEAKTIIIK